MPLRPRIPFIYNPHSGAATSSTGMRQFLLKNATNLAIYATQSQEDAQELVDHFLAEEVDRIVLSGGDGTINRMLPRFMGTQTAMGIFPTGTMNVFARELGISTTDFRHILETIESGEVVETDVFQINGQPFVQMAGIGYDAHFIEETSEENKARLGPLAYILSIAKVFGNKPPEILVTTAEGQQVRGVCALVGNGALYGGHVTLFPNAQNQDQLVDVLVIKSSGYQAVLDLAQQLIKGVIPEAKVLNDNVSYLQTAQLTVNCNEKLPYELDGEYYGRAQEFTIDLHPERLKVLRPTQPIQNEWSERLSALWSLTALR